MRSPRSRIALWARCALTLWLILGGVSPATAQRAARLPSPDKIVEAYLKAIGGKKRVAAIRDATYDWQIEVTDRQMGVAITQLKTPSSTRTEYTFGNGRIVAAANARSAWTVGLDDKLHTLTDAEAAAARLQSLIDANHLLDLKKANV